MGHNGHERRFSWEAPDEEPPTDSRIDRIVKDFLDPWHTKILKEALDHRTSMLRVRAAQYLRELHRLPAEAGFFLVAAAIEDVAGKQSLAIYEREHEAEWLRVCEKYGLDPGRHHVHGPPEFIKLRDMLDALDDNIHVETFRNLGETPMAELFRDNRDEYDRLREIGRKLFFGPVT